MARPSKYDFELCKEICQRVGNGENIVRVLESDKARFPTWPTFRKWKSEHEELLTLYTRSIQEKAESVDAIIDDVLDECKRGKIDVPTARLMVDTYKWKMAKYYPKMFGDKVDVTTNGKAITQLPPWMEEQKNGSKGQS